jgi:hypothetical protein
VGKKYEADFDAVKSRATAPAAADVTAGEPSGV